MSKKIKVLFVPGISRLAQSVSEAFGGIEVRCIEPDALRDNLGDEQTLLFIDWLLPTMSGLRLLQTALAQRAACPLHITMVFDRFDETLFSRAIQAGADDYIVGPLTADLLVERIGLYLPDLGRTSPVITLGDLQVDPSAYLVRWERRSVSLQGNELRLMIHFARNPNRVFSRAALQSILGHPQSKVRERTIDVWISRLRSSLNRAGAPRLLRTVREFGYILDLDQLALPSFESQQIDRPALPIMGPDGKPLQDSRLLPGSLWGQAHQDRIDIPPGLEAK